MKKLILLLFLCFSCSSPISKNSDGVNLTVDGKQINAESMFLIEGNLFDCNYEDYDYIIPFEGFDAFCGILQMGTSDSLGKWNDISAFQMGVHWNYGEHKVYVSDSKEFFKNFDDVRYRLTLFK